MDFTNKTAIVTGGAQGIGKGICTLLAQKNANVIIADLDEVNGENTALELTKSGFNASFYKIDLTNVGKIKEMAEFTVKKYGDIDILINNAGILHSTPIEEITEKEWDFITAINLKAVFFACQAVVPYFKRKNYGKILNMSSMAGRNGGISAGMGYSATKAGIIGLSKGLAGQLAKYKVNVNCICPGTTKTAILESFTEEQVRAIEEKIPIGRLGSVEDIANVACFLCSDLAKFITGATLDVNGGLYIGS